VGYSGILPAVTRSSGAATKHYRQCGHFTYVFERQQSSTPKKILEMADNEPANALPGDAPGSDAGNPAGAGDPGSGGLEAQVARLAAIMSQLMESRASATHPSPSMPPLPRPAGVEQPAYRAMTQSFSQHEKLEGYLRGAGFVDAETAPPEFLCFVRASRESALNQAGRRVVFKDDDEEEDDELDRGIGAQAELPAGVPEWPPRVVLARERTYTKTWQKWLLRQGEASRPEADPRMAEGDTLSVLVLWLDYWTLRQRLAVAAEEQGDVEDALALWKISAAYDDAAYEASRMRVDAITLDQISKPVAEVYKRSNRMELETVTVMPSGIRMLREFNRATVAARTKAAANKAANVPASQTVTDPTLSKKDRKRGNWKKKGEPRNVDPGQKRPTGEPQAAAEAGPAHG
jgi:hypothetical protein